MSASPPLVNGVSPCEGPPGTKIKIWGENLGIGIADVASVNICGQECLEWVEWLSPGKLVCQAGEGYGKGSIIVTTVSGGVGTCSVYFTGTAPPEKKTTYVDPMTVTAVWVEEEWNMFEFGAAAQQSEASMTTHKDPMGFMDGSRRMSQENIRKLCPEGCGELLAENFNPVMYLLENHVGTSYQQLRRGCENLRSEVERSRAGPGKFIKEHLDAFIKCYDTLSDVNELLIRNESESEGGSITDKVELLLQGATGDAKKLFEGVLKSKVKADTARNALTVLQRYRFLFNLPRSIERNIRNGEYEIVTNDYERAKTLFAGTQVNVFAKVMQEVENHVSRLRTDLKNQLFSNPSTLDEQKSLIKHLLGLEYVGDPAWECIEQMHQWALDLMYSCKKKHQQALEPSLEVSELSEDGSVRSHARTLSNISQSSGGGGGSLAYSHSVRGAGPKKATDGEPRSADHGKPKRIQFVEELIDQINKSLPSLWRLGEAYFSKTIITSMLSEQQEEIISENLNKRADFDRMVLDVTEVYTDMVNAALFKDALEHLPKERIDKLGEWLPFTEDVTESCGAWLPLCVRRIRASLKYLKEIELLDDALFLVQQLSVNVRSLCTETLFYNTAKDIEVLHEREDWRVQAEEGMTITSLPVLFENIVVQVLITLREIVVENHFGEIPDHSKPLLESTSGFFQGLLEDFVGCLHCLSNEEETESDERHKEPSDGDDGALLSDDILNKPCQEEKLLLILSNSSYTKSHVGPRLIDCFCGNGYPDSSKEEIEFQAMLNDLDRQVFEKYISLKEVHLTQLVKPGMHAGYFNWLTKTPPTGVRNYITDVLLYLVHVHAEVYAVSVDMTKRVLLELVGQVSSKMLSELQEIGNFSEEGALYAFIELRILQETLFSHMSETSKKNFKMAVDLLGIIYDPPEALKISEEFHRKTKLQFKCFYQSTGAQPAISAAPPKLPPKRR